MPARARAGHILTWLIISQKSRSLLTDFEYIVWWIETTRSLLFNGPSISRRNAMKSLPKASKRILRASMHISHRFHQNLFGMLMKLVWVCETHATSGCNCRESSKIRLGHCSGNSERSPAHSHSPHGNLGI
jgi:hypothetical protein